MSRRILLLTDDYNESLRVETILRKVGFDVISHGSEGSLDKELISFRPEVVVAAGQSSQLSPVSVGMKLKKHRTFSGSVILGFPEGMELGSADLLKVRVDQIVTFPFEVSKLIEVLGLLLNIESQPLLEKLKRFATEVPESKPRKVERKAPTSREEKYSTFVRNLDIDPSKTTFNKADIKVQWTKAKKGWDFKTLETLKDLKEQFVKALFTDKLKK
jgi:DNA-binding response OmpR family regulator